MSTNKNGIAITGKGMISPLGFDSITSCASSFAGLNRFQELDEVTYYDKDAWDNIPFKGSKVEFFCDGFEGFGRFVQLDVDESVNWVSAQDTQIEQVIINLVRNAIEAMEDIPQEQRNLTIKTEDQKDGKLKISISDSGIGIEKELLEQLFDPFITTKEQGMGLGLSISQGIIEMHDDKIVIEDNSDAGVSFSFKLPIVKAPKLDKDKENKKRETKNKEVA